MKLITLSAKARCGKDTTAQYILDNTSNSVSYALATCFKESMAKHFSSYFDHDDVFGYGVDRNSYLIYIDRLDLIDLIKSVFLDFGYDLDIIDIDWSIIGEDNGWTIRQLMQLIGTDVGVNQIDTNIWLNEFRDWMFNTGSAYDTIVMVDCRQVHEIEYVRNQGGTVIHIHRDTGLEDSHITEQGLDVQLGDFVVDNNGTLEDLYSQLDQIIQTV